MRCLRSLRYVPNCKLNQRWTHCARSIENLQAENSLCLLDHVPADRNSSGWMNWMLVKERTSAYRAVKLLNTNEAWAEYTQKARAVKRLVARKKRNAFRFFGDEYQNTQLAQSQATIERIV